jgi:hypothetical protein
MRQWDRVQNDKIEVESKIEMKKRTRKSPDLGDWVAIILEGARRRGFKIGNLSNGQEETKNVMMEWFLDQQKISAETRRRGELRVTR